MKKAYFILVGIVILFVITTVYMINYYKEYSITPVILDIEQAIEKGAHNH